MPYTLTWEGAGRRNSLGQRVGFQGGSSAGNSPFRHCALHCRRLVSWGGGEQHRGQIGYCFISMTILGNRVLLKLCHTCLLCVQDVLSSLPWKRPSVPAESTWSRHRSLYVSPFMPLYSGGLSLLARTDARCDPGAALLCLLPIFLRDIRCGATQVVTLRLLSCPCASHRFSLQVVCDGMTFLPIIGC